jgi:hypothetical protein
MAMMKLFRDAPQNWMELGKWKCFFVDISKRFIESLE